MENECYTCKNCGKKYKSFSNLIKHEEKATCFKFTDREDKLKDNSRDLEFLTDSSKLYQIINGLIESNNKLKKELTNLKQLQSRKNKKIKIEELLDLNFKSNHNLILQNFYDITIDLFALENKSIHDYLIEIILELNENNVVLRSVNIKKNKIFRFENNWKEITDDDWNKILSKIQKNIMSQFINWQNILNFDDSRQSEKYLELAMKINSVNINSDTFKNRLIKHLFENLVQSIETIQYEII